jgi:peptidoglycan biosynthesis protein MviN/MurJ (putative lipid II flippase)
VLHAVKRQDRLLRQAVLAAGANVVLALALVPALGAVGAALSSVLAQGLGSGLAIRAAVQVAGVGVPVAALGRITLAALVMGLVGCVAVISLDGATALAAAVLLGGAAYPLALRALCVLTADDLDRARVLAERLPALARAPSLALARYLCRRPVPTP